MIKGGSLTEEISRKFAVLKVEIDQSGFLGLTNIHKHCENFMMGLLNLVYGYELKNLNDETSNVPGLDLGDSKRKIAYQISSEKTSEKINDTLDKVLRYRHYQQYTSIRIFVLNNKQRTYSLTNTEPAYSFDWERNIIDFDDLLRDIQHLNSERLKEVSEYLDHELNYTIKILRNEGHIAQNNATKLINPEATMEKSGMKLYNHWAVTITMRGANFTVPSIFSSLKHLQKYHLGKSYLYIFSEMYRRTINAKEMVYVEETKTIDAVNHYREVRSLIKENSLKVEFGRYKTEDLLLTNMDMEMGSLLSLIFLCRLLYKDKTMQLEIDIDHMTNGRLAYHSNSSIYEVTHSMNVFTLNPQQQSFSRTIYDIDNASLIDLMQQVIQGFVTSDKSWGNDEPFIQVDEIKQLNQLDKLKKHFELD